MSRAVNLEYATQYCPESNNTQQPFGFWLFRLMLHGDAENMTRLATVYPVEATMVRLYRTTGHAVSFHELENQAVGYEDAKGPRK